MRLTLDGRAVSLYDLAFQTGGQWVPLLRPYSDNVPHLTTATMESILGNNDVECVAVCARRAVERRMEARAGSVDAVLLSTTFICNAPTLAFAVSASASVFPSSR
jgi:hypothetical protein